MRVTRREGHTGIEDVVRSGVRALRSIAGRDTAVERFLKGIRNRIYRRYSGDGFIVFCGHARDVAPLGVYLKGSCDLAAMFEAERFIREAWDGRCAIFRSGLVSDSRSDLLLQSLDELPPAHTAPVADKLKLPPEYFQPVLFEKTFTVAGPWGQEVFPKRVVFISIAADVVRTVYRHREHGVLVDPGGWWLDQSMESVLTDLDSVNWFRQSFQSIGRIGLDGFVKNFSRIVELVRARTGAPVVVLNVLSAEPGSRTHNYQYVKVPETLRRREFNLALIDLSKQLDFPILDIDRILKRRGVRTQIDFNHFSPEQFRPIAHEAVGIMQDLGVFTR